MLRSFFIQLLLLFSTVLLSQDTLRIEDIIKKGKNHHFNGAQNKQNKNFDSISQSILDKMASSLEQFVYLVESEYQVSKNDKTYGRDTFDYYGKTKGVAISSGKELWMSLNLIQPWLYDSDFLSVKDDYEPKISNFTTCPIINTSKKENLEAGFSIHKSGFGKSNIRAKGIQSVKLNSGSSNDGILILYKEDTHQGNSKLVSSVSFVRPEFKDGIVNYSQDQDENILGGFFFTINTSPSMITFELSGVLSKDSIHTNQWNLIRVSSEGSPLNEIKISEKKSANSSTASKVNLKEISEKKSKKK